MISPFSAVGDNVEGSEAREEAFLRPKKEIDFVVPYAGLGEEVAVGRRGRVSARS
jgi:hypothetical protein